MKYGLKAGHNELVWVSKGKSVRDSTVLTITQHGIWRRSCLAAKFLH